MRTATARAYQPRFAGRLVPFEMQKSPQNKAFYGHLSTYSGKAHCIKDSVLLDHAAGAGGFLLDDNSVGVGQREFRAGQRLSVRIGLFDVNGSCCGGTPSADSSGGGTGNGRLAAGKCIARRGRATGRIAGGGNRAGRRAAGGRRFRIAVASSTAASAVTAASVAASAVVGRIIPHQRRNTGCGDGGFTGVAVSNGHGKGIRRAVMVRYGCFPDGVDAERNVLELNEAVRAGNGGLHGVILTVVQRKARARKRRCAAADDLNEGERSFRRRIRRLRGNRVYAEVLEGISQRLIIGSVHRKRPRCGIVLVTGRRNRFHDGIGLALLQVGEHRMTLRVRLQGLNGGPVLIQGERRSGNRLTGVLIHLGDCGFAPLQSRKYGADGLILNRIARALPGLIPRYSVHADGIGVIAAFRNICGKIQLIRLGKIRTGREREGKQPCGGIVLDGLRRRKRNLGSLRPASVLSGVPCQMVQMDVVGVQFQAVLQRVTQGDRRSGLNAERCGWNFVLINLNRPVQTVLAINQRARFFHDGLVDRLGIRIARVAGLPQFSIVDACRVLHGKIRVVLRKHAVGYACSDFNGCFIRKVAQMNGYPMKRVGAF